MGRRVVIEVACERCERVEYRKADEGDDAPPTAFTASLGKDADLVQVHFAELCSPCYSTVRQHFEAIAKKIEGLSPDRKANKEETKG